jgi:hypothetical protein
MKIKLPILKMLMLTVVLFATTSVKSQLVTLTYSYTGSIVNFTVPANLCGGVMTIDARGAQGGSVNVNCSALGGLGARMAGVVTVTPNQVLSILVGQMGFTNGSDAGGGGGSFIATGTVPLVVAGGGGGASNNIGSCGSNLAGLNATINGTATASANGAVLGGVNGNGGGASSGSGCGGGGFFTSGTLGAGSTTGNGKSFLLGGAGGTGNNNNHGGFGGGGCGWFTGGNGGGGGGYSGGATSGNQPFTGGGGGGSFNAGTSQTNTAAFNTGNGLVIITYNIGSTIGAVASSTTICSGSSATLTASGVPTFTWSNSSNSNSIVVSPTTTTAYTVQGTNSLACVSNTVINIIVSGGAPTLAITSSTPQTCLGKTVSITGSGAVNYTLSNNVANGAAFTPTGNRTKRLRNSNRYNCYYNCTFSYFSSEFAYRCLCGSIGYVNSHFYWYILYMVTN